eukprot:gene13006-biopygen7929
MNLMKLYFCGDTFVPLRMMTPGFEEWTGAAAPPTITAASTSCAHPRPLSHRQKYGGGGAHIPTRSPANEQKANNDNGPSTSTALNSDT